jgi:protocatechuate 4,5-dioxygenase beta chain
MDRRSRCNIPDIQSGVAAEFKPADEGWGAAGAGRQRRSGIRVAPAESLILDEFDMTIVNETVVDHG